MGAFLKDTKVLKIEEAIGIVVMNFLGYSGIAKQMSSDTYCAVN